jgi:hypothetical protein
MRRNVFLFLLFALVFSCTKFGKNVTIKGKVLNPITGEGIPNVEVELLKTTAGLPGGNKGIKSTYTDANGNFEISKGGLGSYWLACRVSGDYYEIGWIENGINVTSSTGNLNVKKGKTMHVDFHAVPYGKLQIKIKNQSCFDSNDELKIFRTHSILNFYDNVPNPAVYSGCIDQVGNMNPAPMGWYKYSGTVTKNGSTSLIKDSIFLNEGESKVWEILY